MKDRILSFAALVISSIVSAAEPAVSETERAIAVSAAETAALQARLSDRVSLADYATGVRAVNGTTVWTAALQQARDEHDIVVIFNGRGTALLLK